MKRYRILISAYACEPYKGSEPGVGWNFVREISKYHRVWVITRKNNRFIIEKCLEKEPLSNVSWIYFDLPWWLRFWKRGQKGVHFYYYLWQIGAYIVGKRLHRKVRFDLIHHVTFVNYWLPSFLSLLPIPFIWGPVGGAETTPKPFYRTFSLRGKVYEYFRNIIQWFGKHDPFVRMTAKNSVLALATTVVTARQLACMGCKRIELLSQVGLTKQEIDWLDTFSHHMPPPFRFLSMGRLLHWKGFHLGIQAFASFVKYFPQSEYWIVGDGPERKNLERLAQSLDVADKLRFWGALPRDEALKKLSEVNVLVHPSFHDSGGFVCLEAMAAGLPLISLDSGGPAFLNDGDVGIKIRPLNPRQVVRDLRDAFYIMATDIKRYKRYSIKAKEKARAFLWNKKIQIVIKYYETLFE